MANGQLFILLRLALRIILRNALSRSNSAQTVLLTARVCLTIPLWTVLLFRRTSV